MEARDAGLTQPASLHPIIDASSDGATALGLAARGCFDATARALVQAGAAVDAKAAGGKTPLMMAASQGRMQVVATALETGADQSLRSTQRERAAKAGHDAIAQRL